MPDEIRKKKWGRLGVDTDGDFKPYYVVPDDKRKHVQALKAALKGASRGAARDRPRSRRRVDQLAPARRCSSRRCRSSASSFTRSPRKRSARRSSDAHDVDENLVRAQESRRILDRLYGYTLSPVLWKKVQTGLSAGRVQSVAVRLIVDREEERLAFRAATLLGSRGAVLRRRPRVRRARWRASATRASPRGKDFDAERRADRQERRACCRRPTPRRWSTR